MAKFIKSAQYFDQYPVDKQFEICVIGRSNVGKSSLINALANEKNCKNIKYTWKNTIS